MKKFAKFISAQLIEYAPPVAVKGGTRIIGYDSEDNAPMLLLDGYLPVVEAAEPGPYYDRKFLLRDNTIYVAWTPKPLDDVKNQRVELLNENANALLQPLLQAFSEAETMTWDRQEIGASELAANPEASSVAADLVRAIATHSETPLEKTIADIKAATQTPNTVAGYIIGRQKKIYRQIMEAKTLEELLAISPIITLPS